MNHDEIESCVIRAKRGSQEDLLKLLEQFKPFIFKTAAAYNIKSCDTYDLVQMGYIAVINAVLKYKIGSHTFSSYAFNSVKNELKGALRKNSKVNQEVSLNSPVNESFDDSDEYIDCIEGSENVEEYLVNSERAKELRQAVAKLPEEEIEFVVMVYYNRIPLAAYAEKKNLSYYQAWNRNKKIIARLGDYLEQ